LPSYKRHLMMLVKEQNKAESSKSVCHFGATLWGGCCWLARVMNQNCVLCESRLAVCVTRYFM
jgi:hypothetical protein